jgi:hypothetical protein
MPFTKEQRRAYDAKRNRTSASRNGARAAQRAVNDVPFVAVDGEGVQRPDGAHDYNLLSVGDESLYHADGRRLTTAEIFSFLWEQFDPKSVYVGFFLGYDFAQWIRDLPEAKAAKLITAEGQKGRQRTNSHGNPIPFPVDWGPWEIDILPNGKRFKLRLAGSTQWMYICDAGPLYQASLAKVIDPTEWPEPICTPEEHAIVVAGKAGRGKETVAYGTPVNPQTVAYNLVENEILTRLMKRTNEGLVPMGVKLRKMQWFGPGQAAQAWLKATAPGHTGEDCRAPDGALEGHQAAQASYFGGWFEIMAHGDVPGTTFEYDINSAYPAIIARLPCLLHGTWSGGDGAPPRRKAAYRLVHAEVRGSDPYIGPMPHRTAKRGVRRPTNTAGWFWQHELEASRRAGLVDRVRYRGWMQYDPCECAPPFRAIADLYKQRIQTGKKTPHGKALKLVYNSSYGKMAQSIGNPMFGNAVYASLITAGCRTMILGAIATHPEGTKAVVMVATDGVYFTSPHPGLDLDSERLGAWDAAEKTNLSLFKPGVYWDDKTRAAIAEGETKLGVKSRGVNERALAKVVGDLDRQWAQFAGAIEPADWPAVDLVTAFGVVSPRQALNRRKWHTCGAVIHDAVSMQSSAPHLKRIPQAPEGAEDRLLRSKPWTTPQGDSLPYDKVFGQDLRDRHLDGDLPTIPEGELEFLLMEILGA